MSKKDYKNNQERIASCVNAFDGIPDDKIDVIANAVKVIRIWSTLKEPTKAVIIDKFNNVKTENSILRIAPLFRDHCLFDILLTTPELLHEMMSDLEQNG